MIYMKKFLSISLFALSAAAFADIPPPPTNTNNADTMTVTGKDAAELSDALKVTWQLENSLRTQNSEVKVFYSSTGLTQIVCRRVSSNYGPQSTTTECKIEKSNNGRALTRFRVLRRLG
jgi:hypothetical protein